MTDKTRKMMVVITNCWSRGGLTKFGTTPGGGGMTPILLCGMALLLAAIFALRLFDVPLSSDASLKLR
jgi:hypothetical protein